LRFELQQALVRDVDKPRACPHTRLTASAATFLRGEYDVVIEALDGAEPARALVSQLLARGTAVVTANKALVAAHGQDLEAIATKSGASFRFEATALSAIPFLGTLAARPLVASVTRVVAIVNGTSNYLLTSLAEPGASFESVLRRAQQLGFAEPDPARDLDGLDAADKLVLLTALFGWGRVSRQTLEVRGIRGITADDLAAARSAGGVIKAVVSAERHHLGVRAFVGPVLVPANDSLASLGGALNGIRLDGTHVSNLFFSGPGAGPDVTAATLLDDAIEAASTSRLHQRTAPNAGAVAVTAPATPWFARMTVPGVLPAAAALASLATSCGLQVEGTAGFATKDSRWLLIGSHERRDLDAALDKLEATHRIHSTAFRRI
jgi:homoserine dehydrogenase